MRWHWGMLIATVVFTLAYLGWVIRLAAIIRFPAEGAAGPGAGTPPS